MDILLNPRRKKQYEGAYKYLIYSSILFYVLAVLHSLDYSIEMTIYGVVIVLGLLLLRILKIYNEVVVAILIIFNISYYFYWLRILYDPTWYIRAPISFYPDASGYFDTMRAIAIAHTAIFTIVIGFKSLFNNDLINRKKTGSVLGGLRDRHILYAIIFMVEIATLYFSVKLSIGLSGVEQIKLPFKLNGAIYATRSLVIPVALMYVYQQLASKKQRRNVLIFFLSHSVIDMVLRSSRGVLLYNLMFLMFYLYLERGISKAYARNLVIIFFTGSILWIPISELREYRRHGIRIDVSAIVSQIGPASTYEGLVHLLNRLTGANALMAITEQGVEVGITTTIKTWPRGGLTKYYTHNVLGYNLNAIHSSSPSLLGWLYLINGNQSVFIGMLGLMLLFGLFYILLFRWKAHYSSIFIAYYYVELFHIFTGGNLEIIPARWFGIFVSVLAVFVINKLFGRVAR